MIYEVLNFLKLQLDTYLSGGRATAEPLIMLSGPWVNNESNKGASFLNALSLINVEEEKVFKSQSPQIIPRTKGGYALKAPDIKLNLYLLISAYNKNYEDSLKFISRVLMYFQANSVFDRTATGNIADALPDDVEKIVMELYTASFDQQNQIWASLSTGYIPSVIYKVKTVIVDAGIIKDSDDYKNIQEIQINTNAYVGSPPG